MAWVGLFPLIGCVLIWMLPESPRWLVQEQKQNEAAQSLRRLRQSNDIEAELIEIQQEETAETKQDLTIIQVLSSKEFRWPLITSLVLNAVQQLSGINAVKNKKKNHLIFLFNINFFLLIIRYSSIRTKCSVVLAFVKKKFSGL